MFLYGVSTAFHSDRLCSIALKIVTSNFEDFFKNSVCVLSEISYFDTVKKSSNEKMNMCIKIKSVTSVYTNKKMGLIFFWCPFLPDKFNDVNDLHAIDN